MGHNYNNYDMRLKSWLPRADPDLTEEAEISCFACDVPFPEVRQTSVLLGTIVMANSLIVLR
jgi:hypothetical protein